MNFGKSILLASCLCLFGGVASGAQLLSFDYADDAAAQADWTLSGDYAAGGSLAPVVTASLADKAEGSSALKIEYTHSASPYYVAYLAKAFASPVDMSSMKEITFKVKADAAVASDLWMILRFRSTNGRVCRYVSDNTFPADGTWKNVTVSLAQMNFAGWEPHDPFDHFNMAAVDQFAIGLMKNDATATAGTVNVLIDDLQFGASSTLVNEMLVDDFEYADEAAMKAVWAEFNGTPADATLTYGLTTGAVGAKALTFNVANMQSNHTYQVSKDFAQPVDMSDVAYVQMWMKGTRSNPSQFLLYLQDNTGNRVRAWIRTGMDTPVWDCYWLFFDVAPVTNPANPAEFYGEYQDAGDGNNAVQPWHETYWDGDNLGVTDLSNIVKIILTPGTGAGPVTTDLQFDHIVFGSAVDPASVSDWTLY